jgi:glycosyltransferase involved in cell wall biosynthesis
MALQEEGWDVLLVGRRLPQSPEMDFRPYPTRRFKLWFHKGPLFYLNYNIRLFIFLLSNRFDVAFSNDLDTLPANFIASRLKNAKLVYDSHEYFTGVPELAERKFVKGIWKTLERIFLPSVKYLFTVNNSIAELYRKEYNVNFKVMRNVPLLQKMEFISKAEGRKKYGLPADQFIYILQGSGINILRGAEEAVEAMQYLEYSTLLILGGGDVLNLLKEKVKQLSLSDKVIFKPRMSYQEMMQHTQCADVGLTLDKDTNINYRFSLPNKLFDYIHAGIPVLASDLPEIRKVVEVYKIGLITDTHDPKSLSGIMKKMNDPLLLAKWQAALPIAAKELNWDKEKSVLTETFQGF